MLVTTVVPAQVNHPCLGMPVREQLCPAPHDVNLTLQPVNVLGLVGESDPERVGALRRRARDADGLRCDRAPQAAMIYQDPCAHVNRVRTGNASLRLPAAPPP
jgi:hypothetical protein